MKRIIYKNPDNTVSIIVPSPNALQIMSIEDIARKDVPTGLKYKIVDVSEVPSNREFRNHLAQRHTTNSLRNRY
jgi:ribosomal protein S12